MKYLEIYNEMVGILQNHCGIRKALCNFYGVEEEGKVVEKILLENSKFENKVENVISFVDKFDAYGGITDYEYGAFREKININDRKINRIIFAAGDKISTTLDVTYNEIEIEIDDAKYLIYEKNSRYTDIQAKEIREYFNIEKEELEKTVLRFSTEIEKKFYNAYIKYIRGLKLFDGGEYPQLLPQYALKNRTKTINESGGTRKVIHRIDFAFVINNKVILIEIDGFEHYGYANNTSYKTYYNMDFDKIAEERNIDRTLLLEGYEVYRFINNDIIGKAEDKLQDFLKDFFIKLFKKHNIELKMREKEYFPF